MSLFDDLMATASPATSKVSLFDQLVASAQQPGLDCTTICPTWTPADPPDPFADDGLLKLYCWALVHGPELPEPKRVPHPGVGSARWTHQDHKHWNNGVNWARQALRCVTRARLISEVAKPLVETMAAVRSAPSGDRRKAFNAQYRRRGVRVTTPLPLRQTEKLLRISDYKLDAKRRNETLYASQEAFWRGARTTLLAYKMSWSEPPKDAPEGRSIELVMEDAAHSELYLGAKRIEHRG
jgi:hypothetical protein